MNIIKIIIIMYLFLLLSNNSLLTKRIREYISNNKIAQYIIFFTIVIILTSLFEKFNIKRLLIKSLFITLILICLLKVDFDWAVIIFIIFIVGFFINYYLDCKNKHIFNNRIIEKEKKESLIKINNSYRKYFLILLFLIVIIGTIIYGEKKINQYGNEFSIKRFIVF